MKKNTFASVVLFCVSTLSAASIIPQKTVLRCALDIGSGATKIQIAEVDPDIQTIAKTLYRDSLKVGYSAATKDREIPQGIIEQGIEAIQKLKLSARKALGPGQDFGDCVGVATAAFRNERSLNGETAVRTLSTATHSSIEVISQDEEAVLGFIGGLNRASEVLQKKLTPRDLVVWDIGADSMQMITLRPSLLIYRGQLASESFKSYIIGDIQKRNGTSSPNPMSSETIQKADTYARTVAAEVPGDIQRRLRERDIIVVGIGSVHAKSVAGQVGVKEGHPYNADQIGRAIRERQGWDDKKIGGKFADSQVSNLVLVRAFQSELKIKQVIPVKVDLTDAVLVKPDYW